MGNNSSRETGNNQERGSSQSANRSPQNATFSFSFNPPPNDRNGGLYSSRGGRSSRRELEYLATLGSGDVDPSGQRKETRQERETRKLEKERLLRARERDRSMREENVDGGYLVTLGTYVGPEDFSKIMVRQLQIERKLAPFWRGLNDHSDSWTEHQLVAAARGQPIPPPDEIPPQDDPPSPVEERRTSNANTEFLSKPMPPRPSDGSSDVPGTSASLGISNLGSSPPALIPSALTPGRTKPVASLSSGRNTSQPDILRHEIQLPKNRQINGQPLEAYLYKDVVECPICFLYYPPYLNRTRCCDQNICSECFVQIKRPDPHPPEHTDPNSPPPENQLRQWETEGQLISEPATCPFCKVPELGITYDPPPFRRGLSYANHAASSSSQDKSRSSSRRPRGQSMSVNHPDVITTDIVRPDWANKLHEARRQQDRRSRAATALHQAAYSDQGSGGFMNSTLRRIVHGNGGEGNSEGRSMRGEQLSAAHLDQLIAMAQATDPSRTGQRRGNNDLLPSRMSSRASRIEDMEEFMMMRAIQESLAAEDERKRKEEKDAEKERKKEDKKRAKEQKKADRAAKKGGGSYASSRNNSGFFPTTSQSEHSPPPLEGKGKGRASGSPESQRTRGGYQPGGFNPLEEPTSTLNATESGSSLQRSTTEDNSSFQHGAQELESSPNVSGQHLPQISTGDETASGDLSLNFNSLAEMIGTENDKSRADQLSQQNYQAPSRSRGGSSASQSEPPKYGISHSDRGTGAADDVDSKHRGDVTVIGRTESA